MIYLSIVPSGRVLCSCPGNRILDSGWDKGNWFIHLVKVGIEEHCQGSSILAKAGISQTGAMPRFATRL